jgi:murein L,D-transpeptidase YcbB/YkuD
LGRQRLMTSARAQLPPRTTISGSMIALAAACMLSGCAVGPGPDTGGPILGAGAVSALSLHADTDLSRRLDADPSLVVGGDRLNITLLQRFYARHGFESVWATHPVQTNQLVDTVLRAGDQGLNPDLFHAKLLRRRSTLPPLDRELLLSDAFLSYAEALAQGAVPLARRGDDQVLSPAPVNVAAVLDDALASDDPGAVILALAPTTQTYLALLDALKTQHAGKGITTDRLRKIEVNLERQRWLPRPLPPTRVWVNVADERLVFYRADKPKFSTRVVVGEDIKMNQSPEFRATLDASFFNPPWVIPADIAAREILPLAARDPDYMTKNHMVALPNGEVEQLPGPDAGLGLLMFDMPNNFDVYLHDTPDREIFNLDNRRLSHGCIRVQNPRELASLLLREPMDSIDEGIAKGLVTGDTTRHDLPSPVPVFVVYETAFVDTDGALQFRPDFYHRDAAIWEQLQRHA